MPIIFRFFKTDESNPTSILSSFHAAFAAGQTTLLSTDSGPVVFGRDAALPAPYQINHRYSSKEHFQVAVNSENNNNGDDDNLQARAQLEFEQMGKNPTYVDGKALKGAGAKHASIVVSSSNFDDNDANAVIFVSRVFFPKELGISGIAFVAQKMKNERYYQTISNHSNTNTNNNGPSASSASSLPGTQNQNVNNNNQQLPTISPVVQLPLRRDREEENGTTNKDNNREENERSRAISRNNTTATVSNNQQENNQNNKNNNVDDAGDIEWGLILSQNTKQNPPLQVRPADVVPSLMNTNTNQNRNNNQDDDDDDDVPFVPPPRNLNLAGKSASNNNNNNRGASPPPVRWQWKQYPNLDDKNDAAWKDYNPKQCEEIERAFVAKKITHNLDATYAIAFCDADEGMVQYRTDEPSRWRSVRRRGPRNVDRSGVRRTHIVHPENAYSGNDDDDEQYADGWDENGIRPRKNQNKKKKQKRANADITGDSDDSREDDSDDDSFVIGDDDDDDDYDDSDDETYSDSEDGAESLLSSTSSDSSSSSSSSSNPDGKRKKPHHHHKKDKNKHHHRHHRRDKKDKKKDKQRDKRRDEDGSNNDYYQSIQQQQRYNQSTQEFNHTNTRQNNNNNNNNTFDAFDLQ